MTSFTGDNRPAVLVVEPILAKTAERLAETYDVHRLWEQPDPFAYAAGRGRQVRALVTLASTPLDPRLVEALGELGLIACLPSGYEGVNVAHARARGIEVTHSASVNHEDVADHAVGLILGATRGIVSGDHLVRDGLWGKSPPQRSRPLRQMKVGVVGLGVIGKSVARRLEAFGPEIAWWGRREQPDAPYPRKDSLLALAAWSDILVIAARADATNRGMIDRTVLEALGGEGLLVNVSRGSIVDEDALIAALKDGRLGGAALDVFVTEPTPPERWADVPNTVLTPHSAGQTVTAPTQMFDLLAENLRCFFAGEPLATPVPAVSA